MRFKPFSTVFPIFRGLLFPSRVHSLSIVTAVLRRHFDFDNQLEKISLIVFKLGCLGAHAQLVLFNL